MSDKRMLSLNTKDLVEQCKLLGLDYRGNKGPLIERLKQVRDSGQCYLSSEDIDNPDIEQLVNDGFDPNTRWEILNEPENKVLWKDELEIGDVKYRAITTLRDKFERTGDGGGAVNNSALIQ